MNNKGFTLVEVLAVVAIIAILGIVAVPNILSTLNTSKSANDKVLYENIKTALQTMYEEVYYVGGSFFKYDINGNTNGDVVINDNTIVVNIQTLVNNGFLSGINNEDRLGNKNLKIVRNANGDDIGDCEVSIKKVNVGNKVSYEVIGSDSGFCPKTEDFGG